jgi:putative ABC transport system permease protein
MAAISLLVGGIGIMNIMYVVVTERTQEIGLRKAVGATYQNLLSQFLVEAIIITLVGGIIGIIIGSIISMLVAFVAMYLGYSWSFIVSPGSIFVSVIVATLVGVVFGFFPAKRAAKLDPITALRYE